jgi:hypothetical protein
MKTLLSLMGCAALLAVCATQQAYASNAQAAEDNKFAVGLGIGTNGASIEGKFAPNDLIALRGSFNYLDVFVDADFDDIAYEGDYDASTFGGFIDVAPFKNGFVLSGGAFLGDKILDLDETPTANVQIGDQSFTPSQVGTLTGQAELNSFAPYAGIGYDNFIAGSSDWSFNARAGIMFAGSPKVDLISANGTLSSDPILRQEVEAEVSNIEESIEGFKYYPVISIGVARRF